jgi:DNA-binding response OmpR family regulator
MKILLVEDEPHVSAFIKQGLEEQNHAVTVAFDGAMGKKMALQEAYDILILDVNLPFINGIELCKYFRAEKITIPILMLTALNTTEDVVSGLNSGADDYLKKPFKFQELLARLYALERRHQQTMVTNVIKIADLEINENSKEVFRNGKLIKLTAREYFLLLYFFRNKGIVKSRAEIEEAVWSNNSGSNVVDVYVNYLRNKIDKDFDVKLIHTITGMGYVFKQR